MRTIQRRPAAEKAAPSKERADRPDPLAVLVAAFEELVRSHAAGDFPAAKRAQTFLRGEGVSILLTSAYRRGRSS